MNNQTCLSLGHELTRWKRFKHFFPGKACETNVGFCLLTLETNINDDNVPWSWLLQEAFCNVLNSSYPCVTEYKRHRHCYIFHQRVVEIDWTYRKWFSFETLSGKFKFLVWFLNLYFSIICSWWWKRITLEHAVLYRRRALENSEYWISTIPLFGILCYYENFVDCAKTKAFQFYQPSTEKKLLLNTLIEEVKPIIINKCEFEDTKISK